MHEVFITVLFGSILVIGGLWGAKAGSMISLIMGTAFGLLALIGAWILTISTEVGRVYLLVIAALLFGGFLHRFIKTKKIVPAGVFLILSASFFGFILFQILS